MFKKLVYSRICLSTLALSSFYYNRKTLRQYQRQNDEPTIIVVADDAENANEWIEEIENKVSELGASLNTKINLRIIKKTDEQKEFFESSEVESSLQAVPRIYVKNRTLLEELNTISFVENLEKVKQKLTNLVKTVDVDLTEMRWYLDRLNKKRDGKVFVLTGSFESEAIDLLRGKKNNVVSLTNSTVMKECRMKPDRVYEFVPADFPYINSDLDRYEDVNDVSVEEVYNIDKISAQLKGGLFRNELHFSQSNFQVVKNNYETGNLNVAFNRLNRDKFRKFVFTSDKKVRQAAITDKMTIRKYLNKPLTVNLFAHVADYSQLNSEKVTDCIKSTNHMFDNVLVTKSKTLMEENEFIEPLPIYEGMPNLRVVDINKKRQKQVIPISTHNFRKSIEEYLEGKAHLEIVREPYRFNTLVETINSEDFETKVLKDTTFTEAIIEVKHNHCPACFVGGFGLDVLSLRMKKAGLSKKIKFFRYENDNEIKHLGSFEATPFYIHIRKKGINIQEINELTKESIVQDLRKYSKLNMTQVKPLNNFSGAFSAIINADYLKPDFDIERI